jgi:hypothetical protein
MRQIERGAWTVRVGVVVWMGLLLSACEQDPAGIDEADRSPVAIAVEEATVAEWSHLPVEEELETQVREAAEASGDEEAGWAVTWSAVLAGEGEMARGAGKGSLAASLASEGRLLVSRGAVGLFGEAYSRDVVTGVQGALARIEAVAAGRLPADRADALARARAALQAAAGLQGGNPEAALAAALEASASIRELAPEHAAAEAIRFATEFLAKARTAADGDPIYADALARAETQLDAARGHYEAGAWARAIVSARHSAALSRRVIAAVRARQGERPGQDTQQTAERAIAMATDLYTRAEAKVGSTGTAAQLEALAQARAHLDAATQAYEAAEYGQSIREAVKSAVISRRLIAAGIVADLTSALAMRAIEAAGELYVRAEAKVGSNGTAAQLEALARARALIDQAGDAHAAGDFGLALRLAVDAGSICRRLLFLGR